MISFFIAMFSSAIILFASKISYRNYVNRESEKFSGANDRDILDEISDPYDLYSDEVGLSEEEQLKDAKKHIGIIQNKKEIIKTVPVYFSIFRVFSYILLVFGFLYLKDNQLLEIGYYLLGITTGIIGTTLIYSLKKL